MQEKKYFYRDSSFLKYLFLDIPEERVKLSLLYRPDVDEIVNLDRLRQGLVFSSPIQEIEKELERKNLSSAQVLSLTALPLWEEHNVIPFWSLKFDYHRGRAFSSSSDLFYEGPIGWDFRESKQKDSNPSSFIGGRRWYGIHLIDIEKPENIMAVKDSFEKFEEEGYRLSGLSLYSNPREVRECLEYDGVLHASFGNVEIYGERIDVLEELVGEFKKVSEDGI
ncbi:MAG: hypothetical protein ABIF88_01575 [archaeon]